MTHADWLCYAQAHSHIAERFGSKTIAIRRYFFARGRQLGHELVRCADDFTLKPHDWMDPREHEKLEDERQDCRGRSYGFLYEQFHEQGYTIFTPCSLRAETIEQAAAFTRTAGGRDRLLNAAHPAVLDIATDTDTEGFLAFLHERTPFAFQTLNFKYGTAQPAHSDVTHFDTLPTRGLMAAAWLALEDVHVASGPLIVYPGSHRLGLWDMAQLGIREDLPLRGVVPNSTAYPLYERVLAETITERGLASELMTDVKRGDVIVWANSLLHGGGPVLDPNATRLSQVTHFFFEPAAMFWVPRLSPEDRHLHQKYPSEWAALSEASRRRRGRSLAAREPKP